MTLCCQHSRLNRHSGVRERAHPLVPTESRPPPPIDPTQSHPSFSPLSLPHHPNSSSQMSSKSTGGKGGKSKSSSEAKQLTTRSSKAGLQVRPYANTRHPSFATGFIMHNADTSSIVPGRTYPPVCTMCMALSMRCADPQFPPKQECQQHSSRSQGGRLRRCHPRVSDRRGSRARR